MLKGTKRYVHPTLGEIWISRGCEGYELLAQRDKKALNDHIAMVWKRSGMTAPISQDVSRVA